MQTRADVQVTNDKDLDWLVWLEDHVVARFPRAVDALALAAMLECSPRARAEATAV